MAKRPTVYDVARQAGVSTATVSYTFHRPERVREPTRRAVHEAAESLGYVPSANARGLARGRSAALGIYSFDLMLANDADGDPLPFPLYVDEVQHGFELECRKHRQALLVGSGDSVTDIAGRVDGLAVFPGPMQTETLTNMAQRIPVVAFGLEPGADRIHQINVDNRTGIAELIKHLVDEHGIDEFGFVGSLSAFDAQERFAGFQETLTELGLSAPKKPLDTTDLSDRIQYRALSRLAAKNELPRAIVCASDQHALHVIDLLTERGISVPEEVAVTGFDGILAGRLAQPTLTTLRQPMTQMGQLAAEILARSTASGGKPEHHVLPVELNIGESCGCVTLSLT